MMKYIVAALSVVAAVAANKEDFPWSNFLHAHCKLSADFANTPCDQLYNTVIADITSWNVDTASPAGGAYSIKEHAKDNYIWSTRLTKNKKYTDDQLFEFTAMNDGGCHVDGKSRSQSKSYYDYNVNYCNLWNVYNAAGDASNFHHEDCSFSVKDQEAAKTCAKFENPSDAT